MSEPSVIRGCWQLSTGHDLRGTAILEAAIFDAIDCGFSSFDCADIYTGVEELLGKGIRYAQKHGKTIRVHTKFVPDENKLSSLDRAYVESIVDRTRARLGVDCIDLVQFHWWDYSIDKYKQALEILSSLKEQGKIRAIGLTNFDSRNLAEIFKDFEIFSLQTQVSLFDRRALTTVRELCKQNGVKIYAYGTLLGGFLHEDWLGKAEPRMEELPNRSLVKYKLIIDDACGWAVFQERLGFLKQLADKYQCRIVNIALAALTQNGWIDRPIVGLSPQHYSEQNRVLLRDLRLDSMDLDLLSAWRSSLTGDVYELERQGKHAAIMKRNLNR